MLCGAVRSARTGAEELEVRILVIPADRMHVEVDALEGCPEVAAAWECRLALVHIVPLSHADCRSLASCLIHDLAVVRRAHAPAGGQHKFCSHTHMRTRTDARVLGHRVSICEAVNMYNSFTL